MVNPQLNRRVTAEHVYMLSELEKAGYTLESLIRLGTQIHASVQLLYTHPQILESFNSKQFLEQIHHEARVAFPRYQVRIDKQRNPDPIDWRAARHYNKPEIP